MTENGEGQVKEITGVNWNARLVAEFLRTSYSAKKHGGYSIYDDGKIRVSLDTYVPNVDIWVYGVDPESPDRPTRVYAASYHSVARPETFKPGKWLDHLAQLALKAEEVRDEKKAAREAEKVAADARRYSAVNDAHVFGDKA